MRKSRLQTRLACFLTILLASALSGCGGGSSPGADDYYPMASMDGMPPEVQDAPVSVQEAYQFAAANPQVLRQLPCYCGCGAVGHTSNYACYISGEDAAGKLQFDPHALGCSICVDITQDAMRMLRDGKSVSEIRSYIDETYAQYGPSNMP